MSGEFLELDEHNKEESDRYKKLYLDFLAKSGILALVLVAIFGFLFLFTVLGRNSWREGLRAEVSKVLAERGGAEYSVGEWISIGSPLATSVALFSVSSSLDNGEMLFAAIVRVPTLYGPVPAVYVYNPSKSSAEFLGFAGMKSATAVVLRRNSLNSQLSYWGTKILKIAEAESKRRK